MKDNSLFMRKSIILLFVLSVFGNICAQSLQTHTNEYVIQVWPDVYINCKETYTYYIDDKGNYVRHGKYSLIGTRPAERDYYVGGLSCKYSFSANYKNGELDGAMTSNLSIKGRYKSMNWNLTESFSSSFKAGNKNGELKYNLIDNAGDGRYENKAIINYKNGKVDGDFYIYTKDHLHRDSEGTTFKGHAVNGLCDGKVVLGSSEYLFDTGVLLSEIQRDSYGKVLSSKQYTTAKLTDQMREDLRNNASEKVKASHGFKSRMQQYEWLSWDFYEQINRILARYGRFVPSIPTDWNQSTKLVDFDGVFLSPFETVDITVFPKMSDRGLKDFERQLSWDYHPAFATFQDFNTISKSIINNDTVSLINDSLVYELFGEQLQSYYKSGIIANLIQQKLEERRKISGDQTLSVDQESQLEKFLQALEVKEIKDYLIKEREKRIIKQTHNQLQQDITWLNSKTDENDSKAQWIPVSTEKTLKYDRAKMEKDCCVLFCTLLRKNNIVGWEPWECVYTLTPPYTYASDEKASTRFTFLKSLPSEWDEVRSMRDSIIGFEKIIKDNARTLDREDIISSYLTEGFDVERQHPDAESYLHYYNEIVHEQKEYLSFTAMLSLIQSQSKQISTEGNGFGDIQGNYEAFSSSMNLKIDDSLSNCIKRLYEYDRVQKDCLNFIEFRKVVSQNDIKIREQGSSAKTFLKSYIAYIDGSNLIWTSDLMSNPNLKPVIVMQKKAIYILDSANIKEIEKATRKQKDKSFENLVQELISILK